MAQARQAQGFSLRSLLLIYAGLLAIPLLILLGVFFLRASALERGQTEQHLVQMARGLANDLDRDFERRLTILRALSNSPAIEARDWQGFYAQARAAMRDEAYIVVIDREMRQILNTYVPLGEQPEFTRDVETAQRVFATGRAAFSDVFVSLVTKTPIYSVNLPIVEDGEVRFVLALGLKSESLAPILEGQHVPEGWVCTVWDSKRRVLATTLGPQFIGADMPPAEGRRESDRESVHHSRRIDDAAPVWRAVVASRLSGWRISVAAPIAEVEAPLQRSALLWGGSMMFVAALAMGLAALFARNLTRPMHRLSEAAESVGVGAPLAPSEPGIFAEANRVGASLHESDRKLRERDRQLAERHAEIKALYETAPIGLGLCDRELRFVRVNRTLADINGVPAEAHLGKTVGEILPALKDAIVPSFRRVIEQGEVIDIEVSGETPREPGVTRYWRTVFYPIRDESRAVAGVGVVVDEQLTERKRLEQRRDFLAAEVAHRGKNLLAVIQSISMQTFAPSEERAAFLGRLEALSRTYAALDMNGFEGASIATIVANEVGAFSDRAEIRGPDFVMSDKAAQTMALILHELATNAIKHGAWSGPKGTVAVNWSIDADSDQPFFYFRWRERGGPPVRRPARRGFGATVLFDAPAFQFGAQPEEKFAPEGYSYVLSAAAFHVRLRSEPAVKMAGRREGASPKPVKRAALSSTKDASAPSFAPRRRIET